MVYSYKTIYEVKRVTETFATEIQVHIGVINHMLECREYHSLHHYLETHASLKDPLIEASLQLAQAFIDIDLKTIEKLAPQLNRTYLLKPTYLERRLYSYAHYMYLQYQRKEYMDYFRAMTPLLVDLFRLVIERDFFPELNQYIEAVIKENDQGMSVYKGLQWKQDKIEADDNIIHRTFRKYYGERFNYDHYLSSSHLIKIIDEYSQDDYVKQECQELRQVEKFVRNIIAHEVIHVTDKFIRHRSGLSIEEVHELIRRVFQIAQLKDARQWQVMEDINQTIKEKLKEKIS